MRGFGLIGIVLALTIVGVLAKRQGTVAAPAPASVTTSTNAVPDWRTPVERAQQEVQRALDDAAQAQRSDSDVP